MDASIRELYAASAHTMDARNRTSFCELTVGDATYGEVTPRGTAAIVDRFKEHFNDNTVFYDLGSGLGKMVIHIGVQCRVKKSVGIEFSKERAAKAAALKELHAKDWDNIELHNGNFFQFDLSDATVAYIDNTCMSSKNMARLFDRLPTGCLILYKTALRPRTELPEGFDLAKQNECQDLVERTYGQEDLCWYYK